MLAATSQTYWFRHGTALLTGFVIVAFHDWPDKHSLALALGIAVGGRLADLATTVRMLQLVSPCAAPSELRRRAKPWIMTRSTLTQATLLCVLSFIAYPVLPVATNKILAMIAIAGLIVSVSNCLIIIPNWVHNRLSSAFLYDRYREYRPSAYGLWYAALRNEDRVHFVFSIVLGLVIFHGLVSHDEGLSSIISYLFCVVAANSVFVLVQSLYFSWPPDPASNARRLELEARKHLPDTVSAWPDRYKAMSINAVLAIPRSRFRELLKANSGALRLGWGAHSSFSDDARFVFDWMSPQPHLDETLKAEAEIRDEQKLKQVFDLQADPYERIEEFGPMRFNCGAFVENRILIRHRFWVKMGGDASQEAETAYSVARLRITLALAQEVDKQRLARESDERRRSS